MPDDLTTDERHALVALARHLVIVDGDVSRAEVFEMVRLEAALGQDAWRASTAATDAVYRDRGELMRLAAQVERPGIRRRILQILEGLAEGDGIDASEAALLGELRALWR